MSKSQNDPKEVRLKKDKGHVPQVLQGTSKGRNEKKQSI